MKCNLLVNKIISINNKSGNSQDRTEKPRGKIIRLICMLKLICSQCN